MIKKATISCLAIFFLLYANLLSQTVGTAPYPNFGTAIIDGDSIEWNTAVGSLDWFAPMYRAGKSSKDILSNLFLKYDCGNNILYVLVLEPFGSTIPLMVEDGEEVWVKIDGATVVSADDPVPPIPISYSVAYFKWLGLYNGNTYAKGFEASFPLSERIIPPYEIEVHINAYDSSEIGEESQTSGTGEIELKIDCALPVEMTSFSVSLENNSTNLIWETATEINNYGFDVQRSIEKKNWEKIGFVTGHGNSNSPKFYTFTDNSISTSGQYYYRLKQIDIDGSIEYSKIVEVNFSTPTTFELNQNYPNPFNPSTTISFSIKEKSNVKLTVYTIFGEEVAKLVNEIRNPGIYSIEFNARQLAAGIYFYTLETDYFKSTKKLILLK